MFILFQFFNFSCNRIFDGIVSAVLLLFVYLHREFGSSILRSAFNAAAFSTLFFQIFDSYNVAESKKNLKQKIVLSFLVTSSFFRFLALIFNRLEIGQYRLQK